MKEIYSKSLAAYHMCNLSSNSQTFCVTLGVFPALSPIYTSAWPSSSYERNVQWKKECALKRYALTYCKLTLFLFILLALEKLAYALLLPMIPCMFFFFFWYSTHTFLDSFKIDRYIDDRRMDGWIDRERKKDAVFLWIWKRPNSSKTDKTR